MSSSRTKSHIKGAIENLLGGRNDNNRGRPSVRMTERCPRSIPQGKETSIEGDSNQNTGKTPSRGGRSPWNQRGCKTFQLSSIITNGKQELRMNTKNEKLPGVILNLIRGGALKESPHCSSFFFKKGDQEGLGETSTGEGGLGKGPNLCGPAQY